MKCPFCAEDDLKEEATVCKHCGRDLGLYQSFAARLGALERRVSELSEPGRCGDSVVETPRVETLRSSIYAVARAVMVAAGVAPLLLVLVAWPIADMVDRSTGEVWSLLTTLCSVSVPMIVGLWIGKRYPRLPRLGYISIGATYSVLSEVALLVFLFWARSQPFAALLELKTIAQIVRNDFVGHFIAPTLGLLGGGLLATAIVRKRSNSTLHGYCGENTANQGDYVKRLAAAIAAIQPLLTLAAAVISAYLGSAKRP